jgi:hypothetical protein
MGNLNNVKKLKNLHLQKGRKIYGGILEELKWLPGNCCESWTEKIENLFRACILAYSVMFLVVSVYLII